jgi:cellulose synthase/poly-beta-1,6-N-acetylglucosamine synthase-like glycosyltransferase
MLDARFKASPWPAMITALMFGICYPWHTVGFAATFAIFGLLLSIIARKTGSYVPGLALLYLAYIFHAGLPWHGAVASIYALQPIAIALVCLLVLMSVVLSHHKRKGNTNPA